MAHELNIPKAQLAPRRNISLETDEIWQAKVDLAACLRTERASVSRKASAIIFPRSCQRLG
jgi:hypothetical protein